MPAAERDEELKCSLAAEGLISSSKDWKDLDQARLHLSHTGMGSHGSALRGSSAMFLALCTARAATKMYFLKAAKAMQQQLLLHDQGSVVLCSETQGDHPF